MTSQQIVLQFPTLNALWAFVREVRVNYSEVIASTFMLYCVCNEAEVAIAKDKYGARIESGQALAN